MNFLENRIPPPLVGLLVLILIWLLAKADHLIDLPHQARTVLGLLFLGSGLVIAILANIRFKKAETTINPLDPGSASQLVCSGVFRYTRNPMYLGMVSLTLAATIYLSSVLSLGLVAIFAWFLQRFQIKPEERALAELFGEEYLGYKNKVRRWI